MADDNAPQDELIRTARMTLHMLREIYPEVTQEREILALAYILILHGDTDHDMAAELLAENYDALQDTREIRDDLARRFGYENADDARTKADTAQLWHQLDEAYGDDEPDDEVESTTDITPFQHGRYALAPGAYDLAIRALKPVINPGETVTLEVYITGYGIITGPKLSLTLPSRSVDTNESKILHGFKHPPEGQTVSMSEVEYGHTESAMSEVGFNIQLAGISGYIATDGTDINYGEYTMFWDAIIPDHGGTPTIASEMKRGEAPVYVRIKTTKAIAPGNHNLLFHFTYFDGERWQITNRSVSLFVRNWFQRNHGITWTLGVVVALFAALSLLINIVANWEAVTDILKAL
jgi:hypothetical protein